MVELMVAVAILGIVMSALTALMVLVMRNTAETSLSLDETGDLQFAAAYYPHDVEGANSISNTGPAKCGSGTLVVEFSGTDYSPDLQQETRIAGYTTVATQSPTGKSVLALHRQACKTVDQSPTYPLTPVDDIVVADDLSTTRLPIVTCLTSDGASAACAAPATTRVDLTLTEVGGQRYVLSGTRRSR